MGVLYKIKLNLGGVRAPPLPTLGGGGWGVVKHRSEYYRERFLK